MGSRVKGFKKRNRRTRSSGVGSTFFFLLGEGEPIAFPLSAWWGEPALPWSWWCVWSPVFNPVAVCWVSALQTQVPILSLGWLVLRPRFQRGGERPPLWHQVSTDFSFLSCTIDPHSRQATNKVDIFVPFCLEVLISMYYLMVRIQKEKKGHFRARALAPLLGQGLSASLSASLFSIKANLIFKDQLTCRPPQGF